MTRRLFLLSAPAAIAGTPRSLRNALCDAGNAFHEPYVEWAQRMNASKDKPETIPADALQAFDPLPKLWRDVEHKFRTWIRGY